MQEAKAVLARGHGVRLRVEQASKEDVYRDFARIPERYRRDGGGQVVPEGNVCRLSTPNRSVYIVARGLGTIDEPIIRLDERTRNGLGVLLGDKTEFGIDAVSLLGELCWAWRASDPAYRVAARLAILSVVLGGIGLALGILSIWLTLRGPA